MACRFRLLRDGGGLCPTCGKIDAASAFLESAHVVRQCLDCEQRGYHIPSDHEVHLREIMTSDVLCTAGNSRIARQRIGEIQHVRTFQKEFSDFPTGSVTSNHDPNTTPDCIVHADEGDVAVEVTELLLPEAGQAHENAVQVAQSSIWGAWTARKKLAGPCWLGWPWRQPVASPTRYRLNRW